MQPNKWSDLLVTRVGGWRAGKGGDGGVLDEGGGMGGGVGRWPMKTGQGGRWGGGTKEQCGSNKRCSGWEGKGGDGGGGGTREQCGSNVPLVVTSKNMKDSKNGNRKLLLR